MSAEVRSYVPVVETHLIRAQRVPQTFKIQVMRPARRRGEDARYPVIYATDGNMTFDALKGISYGLQTSANQAPPFILVGISYPGDGPCAGLLLRVRDLLFERYPRLSTDPPPLEGVLLPEDDSKEFYRAEDFRAFLEEELIPFIDETYETLPGQRIYFGHSAGGGFGLFTLFTRPQLFKSYIVSSPGLIYDGMSPAGVRYEDYDFLLQYARDFTAAGKSLSDTRLYMSVGTDEEFELGLEQWRIVSSFRRMVSLLKTRPVQGLEFRAEELPGETHGTAWPIAFMRGVRAVFAKARPQSSDVRVQWGVKIPMRDGILLNATLYLPERHAGRSPVLFTLTPYIAQICHDQALYFASHDYPFLTIDTRGRGDSEGTFRPNLDAEDGHDIVEWLARQPYCDGRVAMWGGSYMGHNQWATARELPPHLATIVPVAAPCLGVDFPARGNISTPYVTQWLVFVSGRALQDRIFADQPFWTSIFRRCYEAGVPFKELDAAVGMPSAIFQEWLAHPEQDAYWDRYNPTAEQYAKMNLPILTITGSYDGNQLGALTHYREHLRHASADARAKHFLIIGPWDHAGTRVPRSQFGGLEVGAASLLDLRELHLQWYDWILKGGAKPEFLRKRVAYYVTGAENWRYVDTLEEVTARSLALYLASTVNPDDIAHSGSLALEGPKAAEPDRYTYDPRDISFAELESQIDPERWITEQRVTFAARGRHLVYHSAPFARDVEVAGFFRLSAWLSIDQPDTDFRAHIHEVTLDGSVVLLSSEHLRARYRESPKHARLIQSDVPLLYELNGFSFIARRIARGHRLRLIFGPLDSMHWQKNHNSGGVVSEESVRDARPVTVRLYHDAAHPSVLHVPLGKTESGAAPPTDDQIFPARSDRS